MEKTGCLVHLCFPTFYHENPQMCRGVSPASQGAHTHQLDSEVNRLLSCDVSHLVFLGLCAAHDTTVGSNCGHSLAARTRKRGGRGQRWGRAAGSRGQEGPPLFPPHLVSPRVLGDRHWNGLETWCSVCVSAGFSRVLCRQRGLPNPARLRQRRGGFVCPGPGRQAAPGGI